MGICPGSLTYYLRIRTAWANGIGVCQAMCDTWTSTRESARLFGVTRANPPGRVKQYFELVPRATSFTRNERRLVVR
ncbi:hypothetical protein V6Z11_A12G077400 [Gossypium hirsutum]